MTPHAFAVEAGSGEATAREGEAPTDEIARLAMWVFLGSELLFFGGIFFAYAVARVNNPAGFAEASRHTEVLLGTINTALLLSSSAAIAVAVQRAEAGQRRQAARWLGVTAGLGLAFVLIKGIEYRLDAHAGLVPGRDFALASTPGAELFFLLYYVATALHAVHMMVGVGGVAALAWGSTRERAWATPRHIDAMALYWHFVDLVWIFLYPLLYLVQRHG